MILMNIPDAVQVLERDLRDIFGPRLQSLVAYRVASGSDKASTLAVVDALTADDLRACAGRVAAWHDAGLATPLLLGAQEFGRSLDAFPLEFGAILSDHVVTFGSNPFEGLGVDPAHVRHACEIQARSHLLHLREGYVETRGRGDALADLMVRSAAPFVALITSVARLQGGADLRDTSAAAVTIARALELPEGSLTEIMKLSAGGPLPSDTARRMFPAYLDAAERLTNYIDRWSAR
jgi:hypothetical protein